MTQKLRWLGLGLSTNLNARDNPNPYRLRDEFPDLFDFVEYSAPLALHEAREQASLFDEMWRRRDEMPVVFHPVFLNLWGPELESPEALRALDDHLEQVGSPWVSNDVAWWHANGKPFPGFLYLPPPLDLGGLEDCAVHAQHVQSAISVPLLLENPFVLGARGDMHVLDFMAKLSDRAGCGLLLDLGHLLSHQLARKLPLLSGLEGFPLEKVVEIHIAGGVVTRKGSSAGGVQTFMDDHSQPVREEIFELFDAVLPKCRSLRAVTFEGDGHPPAIAAITLERLRRSVSRVEPRPGPLPPLRGDTTVLSEPSAPRIARAWGMFEQVFARHAFSLPSQNFVPDASREAEQEIRCAVLAEKLDAWWPCTRLFIAGGVEGLNAFTASPEFRAHFEAEGTELHEAFGAYARRRLRVVPDERIAKVLAFETWMHAAAHRQTPAVPEPGELTLADGITVATFPADLSELTFAVRATKRHLTARGWASGSVDASALEVLFQIAGRSLQRPWTVALRRRKSAGIELIVVDPRMAHLLQAVAAGVKEDELRRRPDEYPPGHIILAQGQRLLMRKPRTMPRVGI